MYDYYKTEICKQYSLVSAGKRSPYLRYLKVDVLQYDSLACIKFGHINITCIEYYSACAVEENILTL